MEKRELAGKTHKIPSKYAGGKSEISFSLWEKSGKSRLYYSFRHYNRRGRPAGSSQGKGYIDLETGEIVAPPSDRIIIRRLLEGK